MQRFFKQFMVGLGLFILVSVVLMWVGLTHLRQPTAHEIEDIPSLVKVEPNSPRIDPAIPEAARSCLPEHFDQATLITTHEDSGRTLYWVRSKNADDVMQPLIALKDGECQVLNPLVDGSEVPLVSVIDPEIAKALAIANYRQIFEQVGGKEKFEAGLHQYAAQSEPETFWMPTENYEALKELGVKLPANAKPTATTPLFEESR